MRPRNALAVLSKAFPRRLFGFLALLLLGGAFGILPAPGRADTSAETKQKISDVQAQIASLEKEIAQYEKSLTDIGTQKTTLQNEINRLDLSRKKIGADISVTQAKITETNLELKDLGGAITDKQTRIEGNKTSIGESLNAEHQTESATLVEHMLAANGLVDAWEEASKLTQFDNALKTDTADLLATKQSLTNDYNTTKTRQAQLVSLKKQLAGQKALLDQNRQEQATLLADTKNKESAYQKILAQKQQAKIDFERQLSDYESTLTYTFDPSAIPKAGSGVLSFPLDPNYMARCQSQQPIYKNIYCITQYFGNTAFARTGAYNGQGHNGVDFGAPEGTRIVAALSGTVLGTGNTDLEAGCYSYGKWVLVQHDNGLASIYGHLSVISVSKGDRVGTGDLLGYSGKTGYATGPHLHFGLYVASQVKIVRLGDVKVKTKCGNVYMPVAPTAAYLNPMSYL